MIGVDPANGELLWEYEYPDNEQFKGIFATPVWNGKDVVMFSSRKVGVAVKLTTGGERTTATLLWSSDKAALGMATPVLIGDMLVGPQRGTGSPETQLLGVDILSGKQLWAKRAFPMPVVVGGAESLVILDHEGMLGLATATRKGLKIHSRSPTHRGLFAHATEPGRHHVVRARRETDHGSRSGRCRRR